MCPGDVVRPEHIRFESDRESAPASGADEDRRQALKRRIEDLVPEILELAGRRAHANLIDLVEEALVTRALQSCSFNQVHTARMLGISRNTLRHRIKKYGLDSPEGSDPA